MNVETVGFAGLGRMGGPMAGRIVAAGHQLVGFDIAGTRDRLPAGAEAVEGIGDLAAQTDVIFLSVPSGVTSLDICQQIVSASDRRVKAVVDLSTIGIVAARECAEILARAGVAYVDAPVSGGIAGATCGSLAMMVGAPAELFEELEPLLATLAKNCIRVGNTPGQGQAMKLLNNYISAAALVATCEATVFGAHMGLDLAKMVEVLNVSSGRSAVSEDKFPRSVIPRTYDFGFSGALMTKDITLYLEDATSAAVPHELATLITTVWQNFNAAHPNADFTYMHKYVEDGAP